MTTEKILTIRDVMNRERVSRSTVKRWIDSGVLPGAYRLPGPGGHYRIPEADLAYVRRCVGPKKNERDDMNALAILRAHGAM